MKTEIPAHVVEETSANDVATAVRQLLAELDTAVDPNAVNDSSIALDGEILLDAKLGDLRCLVVREGRGEPGRSALSPREQEIARMVSQGYTNKTIAGVLDISLWTVSTHLRRIFAKLGVSNRAAMVAITLTERRRAGGSSG